MILLIGAAAGLLTGLGWALRNRVRYEAPALVHLWLVPTAFLMQVWERNANLPIIASQLVFIVFAFRNRAYLGMKLLLAGAALNFLAMASNGGYMPINPQTASRLFPNQNMADVPAGTLFGVKDILLPPEQTRFEILADRFLPPAGFPYQFAFSLGDVFIAAGVFWLLARQSQPQTQRVSKFLEEKRLTP